MHSGANAIYVIEIVIDVFLYWFIAGNNYLPDCIYNPVKTQLDTSGKT